MTERIIQLSHYHSGTQTSNAEWTSTIPNAITLNKGDSIAIHSIFLDVALSNNQTITIEKDVTINLTFTPYICMGEARLPYDTRYSGSFVEDNPEVFPVNTPYYTVYNVDDNPDHFEVYEETFTFKVLSGIYTPQSLAEAMTDSLTNSGFTFYPNPQSQLTPPDLTGFPQSTNTFCKMVNQYYGTTVGDEITPAHAPYFIWTKIGQPVDTWIIAPNIPDGINNYVPNINGATQCSMTLIGASEVGIEWNNGRFSFFNMLPYYLPADKPSVWSAKFALFNGGAFPNDDNVYWATQSTYGGVLFTGYSDDFDSTGNTNFFNSVLGIDPAGFCMDKATIASGGYGTTFQNYITTPKVSLDLAYINKVQYFYKTINNPDQPRDFNIPVAVDLAAGGFSLIQSNITNINYPPAFVGDVVADLSKGGHYLVQVKNMNSSQMVGDQLGETGITAILSKQYNFSTTITGYPESGVPYVHNGETPLNLQNFHVCVMNPNSRRPIASNNIGDKSYIYLSVVNQPQQEPVIENKKTVKKR